MGLNDNFKIIYNHNNYSMCNLNSAIFFLAIVLIGCTTASKKIAEKIGSDRDKHGCIHSAGYTWSEINKTCLRPFELKNQLF